MRKEDAPLYKRGLSICGAVMLVNLANTGLWWWHYVRENKKREREFQESGLTVEERDHQNFLAGEMDLTDMQVGVPRSDRKSGRRTRLTTEPLLPVLHVIATSLAVVERSLEVKRKQAWVWG